MKKLPFDLDKALAGAKLVTRDWRIVTGFREFPSLHEGYNYQAEIGEKTWNFTGDGKFFTCADSDGDLFLLDDSDQPAPDVAPAPPMPMVFPPWLTERKFYAAMALQGILAAQSQPSVVAAYREAAKLSGYTVQEMSALEARHNADALIAELNKEPNK